MAALDDDVKQFIVQALACYDTPSQVSAAVKDEFGLEVTRMQASLYDPTKAMGKDLSEKYRILFHETRKKFIEETSSIPIANQAYRLRSLDRMLQKVEKQGNILLASQLLEQASKEIGGAFTNRQKIEVNDITPKSPEQVDKRIAELLEKASQKPGQ